ncbi:hypothetical protein E3P81_01612 [Wallemia ichthyophaga]|nr:hypothetical protein E3P97_01613 [Wallemia ichthyophaga]TIA95802.1 hypothetical protein E3P95_03534 [Wallemia ichthyophaga]TIA96844.1 hypothetical protein E3P94_03541 [Wallemia ichthyophaga]TIB02205.1 hypothetical protein E3P96_02206 [Wallemia ichthyophaga]TIB33704.1 hypothetical protein E3P85_01265 [Wallemia ichthyophaga]
MRQFLLSFIISSFITIILLSRYSLLSTNYTPKHKQLLPLQWQNYDYVKLVDHGSNSSDDNSLYDSNYKVLEAPLDIWNPILPHSTPINDITIRSCSLPPSLEYYFGGCYPPSTSEDNSKYGPWVRVGMSLNVQNGRGHKNNYLYYRRSRRLDVSYIDDIKLLSSDSSEKLDENWFKVKSNPSPNTRLYYHTHPPSSNPRPSDAVTEVDILFGDGPPWPDFKRVQGANIQDASSKTERMTFTIRKGYKHPKQPEQLKFRDNGQFRILQIADLHFSVGNGTCRDTDKSPCQGDPDSIQLMAETLDDVKPDFVVFTGDQLNGQGTSFDAVSVISKVYSEVIKRKIPFTAIFGNHDSEMTDLPRSEQMRIIQALPFSLAQPGPSDIHGVGNHVLKVYSPDGTNSHLLTMYLFDTHGLLPPPRYNPFKNMMGQYDYIRQNQIDWFVEESDNIKLENRPFIPKQGEVFDDTHKRISQTPQKANALVFAHIPLREYYDSPADLDANGTPIEGWGSKGIEDGDGASGINGGFFNVANELRRGSDTTTNEIRVIAHGHCHLTDECRLIQGTWICFGGGSSYSGYGKKGHDRRFRVYDVTIITKMSNDIGSVRNVNRKDKVIALSKSIEPTLRTLAWLLPGRFDDSELVAEMIFSSLNMLTQSQDAHSAKHSLNAHSRYTSSNWGRLHALSAKLLSLTTSLQLLGEIVMHRREKRDEQGRYARHRWNYITAIEALKFTLKLVILLKTQLRPLVTPCTPSRDQDVSLDPECDEANRGVRGARSVVDLKTKYGSVDNYLHATALDTDSLTPPSALVRPLSSGAQVFSELMLIAEPLVYVLALRRQFARTQTRTKPWRTKSEWTPLLLSLSMSVMSRQLRKYGHKSRSGVSPYSFDVNKSSIEANEQNRREQSFIRYLLRGPIWHDFTKPRVESVVSRLQNWPLVGIAAGIVGDYIPLIDDYHFYTSQ